MVGLSEELNASFDKLMTIERDVGSEKVRVKSGVANEWKDIPMELLLQIVSLVDHRTVIIASGVCRGWRESLSRGLTHLSLTWCKKSMNELVLSLAPKFKKLETLILRQDKAQLEDSGVEAISENCHELQILDLSKSFKLTDKSLISLARGCRNLTTLNISGCSTFGDVSVAHLVSRCRKLKVINLCGCVGSVSDTVLQAIGSHCNQLEYLNIGWCEKVTDVGVLSLAYGCPDLRNLDLCACSLITDESVVGLARRCVRLRSLGLYYCQNITDRAMYSLAQSRVRPAKMEEGLAALNISQCTALTPPAVQALCDTFPALHTCPRHSSLIMSGCLSLTSVHCACTSVAVHPNIPNSAH